MRCPSSGEVEDPNSARFHPRRTGKYPDGDLPVEGQLMSQTFEHRPAMVDEVVALFAAVPPGLVVDATVGGGGHAGALLEAHPHLRLGGVDRDPDAIRAATRALHRFGDRVVAMHHGSFAQLESVVTEAQGRGQGPVTGVLFDLGVSSPQLDLAERGFSYRFDAPLDMRMDPSQTHSAADFVNTVDEETLARLIAQSGERRFARRIARQMVAHRPLETTGQLVEVVTRAIPAAARRTGGHPARRVFQAIRIAVNDELEILGPALEKAMDLLAAGGRCVVLSYHSGEDRIVKDRFLTAASGGCVCPTGLPCVCGAVPSVRLLNRGARKASATEISQNPRAREARLRACERLPVSTEEASSR